MCDKIFTPIMSIRKKVLAKQLSHPPLFGGYITFYALHYSHEAPKLLPQKHYVNNRLTNVLC